SRSSRSSRSDPTEPDSPGLHAVARASSPPPLARVLDGDCRVDQADMGKRLREVAQCGIAVRVNFLCEQTEIAAPAEKALEQFVSLVDLPEPRQVVHPPERADSESPFPALHPVIAVFIAVD